MFQELGKDFIKELSVLLAKDFAKDNWLNAIGKAYTGIINGDNVGIMSTGNFKDAQIAGCDPEWGTPNDPSTETWSLNNFMIAKKFCYDSLIPELKRYQALYELSSNDAAKAWITAYLEKAFAESVLAHGFFGDVTADAGSGIEGMNGIVTQMLNYVSDGKADASQVTAITTNTKAYLKTGTNAVDTVEALIDDAPAAVKASKDAIIIMNQAMYDALAYNLKINKGIYIESQWSALFGGLKETTYNGYKLVVIPELDGIMAQLPSTSPLYGKSGLAIFTTTDNLLFGTTSDEEVGVSKVQIEDNFAMQATLALVKYSLGAVVADAKGFQIAY